MEQPDLEPADWADEEEAEEELHSSEEATTPPAKRRKLEEKVSPAKGPKLTKSGCVKLTRGQPKRASLRASAKVEAVEAFLAVREMGHPVRDQHGRACGTRYSYNSVYNWSKKISYSYRIGASQFPRMAFRDLSSLC